MRWKKKKTGIYIYMLRFQSLKRRHWHFVVKKKKKATSVKTKQTTIVVTTFFKSILVLLLLFHRFHILQFVLLLNFFYFYFTCWTFEKNLQWTFGFLFFFVICLNVVYLLEKKEFWRKEWEREREHDCFVCVCLSSYSLRVLLIFLR